MGGLRAAVAAAIVSAEKDRSGAAGAFKKLTDAKFDVSESPFAKFITDYFA